MPDADPDPSFRGRDLVGLGGMLAGAVVVGLFLGLLLDHVAGTSPAFTLVGIALGIAAGITAFVVRVRSVLR
ncbi:MAG TPA: AtpZ/AtpI family protein [Nocardioides sp.]|jgi:F0F1-type ATP synthase assembly protein I|nr:AtpZ/AtpI family protein [Nocardioides sp.]